MYVLEITVKETLPLRAPRQPECLRSWPKSSRETWRRADYRQEISKLKRIEEMIGLAELRLASH